MSRRFSASILVAVLLSGTQILAQQNSATAGGNGGTAFTLSCAGGEVLVGIDGRAAAFLDQVRGVCARVNEILMPENVNTTGNAGGTGGKPFRAQRCPSGWAVRGLRVRAGNLVDSIRIRCGRILTTGLMSETRTHPVANGGSGGTSQDLNCPNSLPADRLRGRAGGFIDRIGLRCDVDAIPAVVAADPNRPDFRVAIRDYPSIVTNVNQITWRVELWNVGGPAAAGTTVDITTPTQAQAAFVQHPSFTRPITCNTTPTGARCTSTGNIPTGARVVVQVTMTPASGSVDVGVSARADAPGQIQESNEDNNTDTQTLVRVLTL